MRTIKFRGKRVDNGEWVYGSFTHCHDEQGNLTIIPNGDNRFVSVHPETVGQFTGLLDKNGKEIYEGDVIKFQKFSNWNDESERLRRHTANVIFKDGCFMWEIVEDGSNTHFHYSSKTEPLKNTCSTWGLEIIGNIHDNHLNEAK